MHSFAARLQELQSAALLRQRRILNSSQTINFAGNDYLGLAQDQRVKKVFADAAHRYGLGSSGSPMITGYHPAHQQLEQTFAAHLGRERALLFNSGYHANIGVMAALADRSSVIVADKHCHASMLDGMHLSRATVRRYRHQDLTHAAERMTSNALLVTESVFSMSGEMTDLSQISSIANQFAACLIVDDAHGFGVIEHDYNNIDVLVTPLGKTLGSMGAIVSGSHDMIEYILQTARSYCYSTALPPAICAGSLKALQILQKETWRREKLLSLCAFFIRECDKRNLPLLSRDITPIKAILTQDNNTTLKLQQQLLEHGFFTAAIRPPTVPHHTARLRISLNVSHSEAQISALLDCLAASYDS